MGVDGIVFTSHFERFAVRKLGSSTKRMRALHCEVEKADFYSTELLMLMNVRNDVK